VVLRVVNDKQRITYQPSTWSSPYYTSFWGYYGYGWGAVYDPGDVRDDRIVSLETLIYSVPRNTLMWPGMSETENPKSPSKTVEEVVKEAVKEMKKLSRRDPLSEAKGTRRFGSDKTFRQLR